jgi:peptidoglycan pentaglycine glycine transferase (the first glycine)
MNSMSAKKTYSIENNLFQSTEWEKFEDGLGRKGQSLGNLNGIVLDLPLGQSFLWFQKGPDRITSDLITTLKSHKETFIRLEPGEITASEIEKYDLKPVGRDSLLSGQTSPKATRVLDLTKSEDELLSEMKSKTRYNIRLAEKKGVKVTRSSDVKTFYDLLLATSGKDTGYFPHGFEYYEALMRELGPKELAQLFIAEHDGNPLAAILVTFYGDTATYLHGGQSQTDRNLMAPYLCQWTAIVEAKNRGCLEYDFWGVSESDDPNDPWSGITRFKEGFGGEKVLFPGGFDLVLKPFWYNVLTLLARLRHLVRK